MISNFINHLRIHDDGFRDNQIRHKFTNIGPLVSNRIPRLLPDRNSSRLEFHNQGIFIGFLMPPVAQPVEHFQRRAHNTINLILKQQLFGFHNSRSFAVKLSVPLSLLHRLCGGSR